MRQALVLAICVAALAWVLPSGARVGDAVLTPIDPTLKPATVGTYYAQAFGMRVNGEGRYVWGCRVSVPERPDLKANEFDDCAKLPPGLVFDAAAANCSQRDGCLMLEGTPTKAGTYSFRVAGSDGNDGFVVRQYTLEVRGFTSSDLVATVDEVRKQPGLGVVEFKVENRGPATSAKTTAKIVVKMLGKVGLDADSTRADGFGLTDCSGLTCTIRATPKGQSSFVKVRAKLVGREGTYVRLRLEVECAKDETSCANNDAPGKALWERVTVPGR